MTIQANLGKIWALTGQVTDPGDTKYALGWQAEIPTFQNFNFVLQNYDKNFLAIAEKGIFDWQDNISYEVGTRVRVKTPSGDTYFWTCVANNLNEHPFNDLLHNYWTFGEVWGLENITNGGLVAYNITPKLGVAWTSNDISVYNSFNPTIGIASPVKNWLIGNIEGEMCLIDTGTTKVPNSVDLRPASNVNSHRIFHEGHPPTQAEVSGTIPANPSDGVLYGRRDGNWVKVTTVTVAEHPPQPVEGNGAGWYNKEDGYFYLDINDGDSSQWVPASPKQNLDTNYVKKSGDEMSGALVNKDNIYSSDAAGNALARVMSVGGVYVETLWAAGGARKSTLQYKQDGNIEVTGPNLVDTPIPVEDADLTNKKYTDGVSQQAIDGFTILPNGLMMVWGKLTCVGAGNQAQTFHTPFPNNCFNVQATYEAIAGNGAGSVAVRDFTKTGFVSDRVDSNLDGFFYFYAIGN